MNLTDNEIIEKVTENLKRSGCLEPFEARDIIEQKDNKIAELTELLNRQKAEIERLNKLQKPTGAGGFKVENGKIVFYSDMLNGYRHEYKDLDEIAKELNLYMHTDYKNLELISHHQHKAQTAKTDAIKEFAERLKEMKHNKQILRLPLLDLDIDNLVKEMVGD